MLYVVLFFLLFSLLLYVILAGADFGAGIVELFSSKESRIITKGTVYRVMGPIWEANHIWIIIVIVILWIAFPDFYNVLTVYLHIPLTLVLMGITLRGVAFVFRHYDAYKGRLHKLYDWMFRISSLVTPIFIGLTFGAMVSGKLIITNDYAAYSFYDVFIAPWFNIFSLLVGFFFMALCAFLSAILLIGEAKKEDINIYLKKSIVATVLVILSGFFTLTYGYLNDIIFVTDFIENRYSNYLILLSGILIYPLLRSIKKGHKVTSRGLAGAQVILILTAALIAHFPHIIITSTSEIGLLDNVASEKVINSLGIALIIGGSLILPGLFHLFKSFKIIKVLDL
ncbi:cytochrome BD ubiquinol oxidase subunit II [Tamlana sedimentorum]|uniref:Cytochrome BD ubiquinol oxidase subunit II n=1 Tax=Neotamlana sedimentorum TaxID=1435349 RepID=A0A0D7WAF1_9FLAO|nr:cytochrome d ubiquinol oxidase subunit II [Tamlana sedimentorum]KJD35633.1 cytochrome BD ubiquinol oxidase subunit II [Tamlana sedimentorum]